MSTERVACTPDETIARMRVALDVRTDADLADSLGVTKQTVSGWKRRGSVPLQYVLTVASRTMTSVEHYTEAQTKSAIALKTNGSSSAQSYGLYVLFYERTRELVKIADSITTAMWWGAAIPHLIQFYEYEIQTVAQEADLTAEDAAEQIASGIIEMTDADAIKILKGRLGL